MDKVINKTILESLIVAIRTYLYSDGIDAEETKTRCDQITRFAALHFPNALRIVDLVSAIVSFNGFKPDATYEDIYKVLDVLGWVVKE